MAGSKGSAVLLDGVAQKSSFNFHKKVVDYPYKFFQAAK